MIPLTHIYNYLWFPLFLKCIYLSLICPPSLPSKLASSNSILTTYRVSAAQILNSFIDFFYFFWCPYQLCVHARVCVCVHACMCSLLAMCVHMHVCVSLCFVWLCLLTFLVCLYTIDSYVGICVLHFLYKLQSALSLWKHSINSQLLLLHTCIIVFEFSHTWITVFESS